MRKGSHHSPEAKLKLSIAHTNNPSRYWLGKKKQPLSDATKEKLSLALRGRKLSDETKRKIGMAQNGRRGFRHSEASRRKIGDGNRGEKSHMWKGGISDANKRIRLSVDYRLWREAVYLRDNYTCQKTSVRGGDLHPHHILNYSQYPDLRFVVENGVTLSVAAHRAFHRKYGNKNNTREQFNEFLLSTTGRMPH